MTTARARVVCVAAFVAACGPVRRTGGAAFEKDRVEASDPAPLPAGARRVAEPEEIPSLEAPPLVAAADAGLTDEDEVAGLVLPTGQTIAVPLALLARTPVVNLAGPQALSIVLDASSGAVAAYMSPPKGLGATGVVLAESFVVHDRGSATLFLSLTGEVAGAEGDAKPLPAWPLDVLPWAYFRAMHPESQVVGGARDASRLAQVRGGVASVSSVDGVPAATWVLGVREGGAAHAFVVSKLSGIAQVVVGGEPLLVVPVAGGALVRVRRIEGKTLQFRVDGDRLIDDVTGSSWTLDGRAFDGPSAGLALPRPSLERRVRWFAWKAVFPTSTVE